MVLGCLCSSPLREHTKYLGRRMRLPLWPPTTPTRDYGLFAALRRAIPKPKAREASKNACILEDMWILASKRVSVLQDPAQNQTLLQRLGCMINTILKGGRKWRTEGAGEAIEMLLVADPPSTRNTGTEERGGKRLRSTARCRSLGSPSSG